MIIKQTMHVHYHKYSWDEKPSYRLYSVRLDDTDNQTYIGEQEIEIEVPDNYDPTAQQIAALEAKKKKINDEFLAKIFEINDRITKLQSLEFTA